ncbi:zinc ribbon domain-containing protein [Eubacteriaceae bacterium ES2]|nr:zinc ribbon domain-containing protein [Eubacteriaceae bacterium ES2]
MAKYCPKCYAGVGDDDLICGNCGASLTENIQSNQITLESENPLAEPVMEESNFESTEKSEQNNSSYKATYDTPPPSSKKDESSPVLSLGDWMLTLLLLIIPIVNLVMLIIWSADSSTNPSKRHFAQAQLIFMGIGIVLSIIFSLLFAAVFVSSMNSMMYY